MYQTWKKNQTLLFLDTARKTVETPDPTPDWARIGKSTILTVSMNPSTEEQDYIEDEAPTTELDVYKPSIDQELALIRDDKAFDAVYEIYYNRPTGEETKRKTLLIFPSIREKADESASTATAYHAWLVESTVTINEYSPVDKKIKFALPFAGTIAVGSATVTDGKPVFTKFPDQTAWVSTADAT